MYCVETLQKYIIVKSIHSRSESKRSKGIRILVLFTGHLFKKKFFSYVVLDTLKLMVKSEFGSQTSVTVIAFSWREKRANK